MRDRLECGTPPGRRDRLLASHRPRTRLRPAVLRETGPGERRLPYPGESPGMRVPPTPRITSLSRQGELHERAENPPTLRFEGRLERCDVPVHLRRLQRRITLAHFAQR